MKLSTLFAAVAAMGTMGALAADPVVYGSDNFESTPAGEAPDINAWVKGEGDNSIVKAYDSGDGEIEAPTTFAGQDFGSKYLNLDTDGNQLSLNLTGATLVDKRVFADAFVKLVASEDAPTLAAGSKMGIWLAKEAVTDTDIVAGDLVLVASNGEAQQNFVIAHDIADGAWCRLTVESVLVNDGSDQYFRVWKDGVPCTATDMGMSEDIGLPADEYGACWAMALTSSDSVSGLAFQGTGAVDNVVVNDTNPFVQPSTIYTLTFAAGTGVSAIDMASITSDDLPKSVIVTPDTDDWYVAAQQTPVDGVTADQAVNPAGQLVFTVTALEADGEQTFVFEQGAPAEKEIEAFGDKTVDSKKAYDWAAANNLAKSDLTADVYDQYLMNIAPDAKAELTIESIEIADNVATIVIDAGDANLETVNGTLMVQSADTLEEFASAEPAEVVDPQFNEGKATIELSTGAFFKAWVK